MNNGVVTGVTITAGGSGYTSNPTVEFEAPPAGTLYPGTVTIAASTPLPARIVPGFAIGGQGVQGNGGADALNCAMIGESRASNTQFRAYMRAHGVALTVFTTPDNTQTLPGLAANRLGIPHATLRVNSAGWNGSVAGTVFNFRGGSQLNVRHFGTSYNGVSSEHDIFFAQDAGSLVQLADYRVVAGAGDKVLRAAYAGAIRSTARSSAAGCAARTSFR